MGTEPATLGDLATAVGGRVIGDPATPVADVTHDSRSAGPGMLFVAVRGFTVDGHRYVTDALRSGAAVCVEEGDSGPALVVDDTRAALGPLASFVHGEPSRHLTVIGITGTNGKTTVTHLLESIVSCAGGVPGLVGTVGARVAGMPQPVERTTPEASDLQRLLRRMVETGVTTAALEVSSHALSLGRVGGTRFDVSAFTNLSQDHLDFHADLEDYYQAKKSLFQSGRSAAAVIWVDDPAGRRLAGEIDIPVTTVGLEAGCAVTARDVVHTMAGSSFTAEGPGGGADVELRLAGGFNVANALVAAACAAEIGIDWDSIAAGISRTDRIAGRFEMVETGEDYTIVVDYAHTPEGVAAMIDATRRLAPDGARLLVVVGAGGDRDRAKRPLMGAAAATADVAFITSDNPRSEDPAAIAAAVAAGAGGGGARVEVEVDRRAAIRAAVRAAGTGDVVLILGKGHERGQEFAETTLPFDDAAVAREEAAAR